MSVETRRNRRHATTHDGDVDFHDAVVDISACKVMNDKRKVEMRYKPGRTKGDSQM